MLSYKHDQKEVKMLGLFFCLWFTGCIVSICFVPAICSIVGFDSEEQVAISTIGTGFLLALIVLVSL